MSFVKWFRRLRLLQRRLNEDYGHFIPDAQLLKVWMHVMYVCMYVCDPRDASFHTRRSAPQGADNPPFHRIWPLFTCITRPCSRVYFVPCSPASSSLFTFAVAHTGQHGGHRAVEVFQRVHRVREGETLSYVSYLSNHRQVYLSYLRILNGMILTGKHTYHT